MKKKAELVNELKQNYEKLKAEYVTEKTAYMKKDKEYNEFKEQLEVVEKERYDQKVVLMDVKTKVEKALEDYKKEYEEYQEIKQSLNANQNN